MKILREQNDIRPPKYHEKLFAIKGWEKFFDVFHITPKYLGKEFTPRLRPPGGPFEDEDGYVIEDEVTPRFSVAKNISRCFKGLGEIASGGWHVYVAKDVKTFRPFFDNKRCPNTPGNPYGFNFSWQEYAEDTGVDPEDSDNREIEMTYCVPDVAKTGERWVTKETGVPQMRYLGKTISGDQLMLSKDITSKDMKPKATQMIESLVRQVLREEMTRQK